MKEKIKALILEGKSNEEILKILATPSEQALRQRATNCAETLHDFIVMNDVENKNPTIFNMGGEIYKWLIDEAWMEPKDGWKK